MKNDTKSDLVNWVEDVVRLTTPDHIHWCDGSDNEWESLLQIAIKNGELISLNPVSHPRSFLHRSNPNDVARTEEVTFICTKNPSDSGRTNN